MLAAEDFTVSDHDGNEISVQHHPSEGDLLIIWLTDHEEVRSMFDEMVVAVNRAGAEIWRVDLLESYFLPRSSEVQRKLSGNGVLALLEAAHSQRNKRVLLVAYDRMPVPVPLLRGARLWQQQQKKSRLTGAVLFYPNLFGPAPVAGQDPIIDPIVSATNIPVVIYQPEIGSQRWRLSEVMGTFWRGGSPAYAYAYIVPRVRDWFFMGETDHGPGDLGATHAVPQQLLSLAAMMERYPKPASVTELKSGDTGQQVMELVEFKQPVTAPGFVLPDFEGKEDRWQNYRGKVTLVNFWATWCPPCVEEVPSLNGLAARYRDRNFEVVSIDFRETNEQLQAFMKLIPVDFPVLMDRDGKTAMQWKVFSFPSSFIIDRAGNIRYSTNRAIDWDTAESWKIIDQLLTE
ncbi:hypothetical protein BOW53_14115 [Solemya pervernicosa gill symbiont]|uniref:Thioredoxin domain-containing protein n=1 Tax=Solemya pervernicosa gill symbiont TaxID=642797 RepID=A0A1T2L157_9GAMM|nr:hypothetical protein BOW53_14115 [Solemya pervernicosa gill symbiont]